MSETFRAVPNGTIRLTAATASGSAPVLMGLPAGGGCTVLVQNRGTVPVLVEFGTKATMALPTVPSDTVPGSRSIPVGGVTLVRLQQGERHVAIAVPSGTPDVEITVGDGGGDVFAVPGAGGSGGGAANQYPGSDYATAPKQDAANTSLSSIATNSSAEAAAVGSIGDAATASGASTTVIGALRAIRDRLLGTLGVAAQDSFVPPGSPFSASALGVLFTVDTTGYQSIAVQLSGTFVGFVTYEVSNDNATWYISSGASTSSSTGGVGAGDSGVGARVFPVSARYFRARVTSYTSGTFTVIPYLRSAPYAAVGSAVSVAGDATAGTTADAAYTGSGNAGTIAILKGVYGACVAATPTGTNVIGSTTLRSTGTNRSGSVGTTASTLMAANTNRQGWKIKNDSAGDIWINFDATATAVAGSGNIRIPSGGYLASEPGFVETGAMSAIGSATNLAITAREH